MAAGQMVLKCAKTGRLFFSTEEATEHAEAFGKEYANFEEVSVDTKVWVCIETGRPAYTEADVSRIKQRDPESKTFEEKTVAYLMELQKKKEQITQRKDRFFDSVNAKKLESLTLVKGHSRTRAAKALHFTKDKGTIEAAEAWLSEHEGDADLDKLTDEFLDSVFASASCGSADVMMGDANADVSMMDAAEAPPDDRKEGDPNPPEIKEQVNQELLKQIMEMGFSELRAEKALYKTDNAGLEHAVNWLSDHAEDADIDLPLLKPGPQPPEKPKMSKEEAEAKALELQKKLRQKRAEEEKLSDREKERMRIESTKMMVEANEKLKEEERLRAIEQMKREKDEHERHRAELKEQLRRDYIERFGKEPPPEEEEKEKSIKEKSSKDQVAHYLGKLKKTYKDTDKEGLKTCLTTLRIYVKNLQDNPQDPKFKKLKLENKAFQSRVAPFDGAIEFLDVMGFEKKEDCLEQRKSIPDGWLCGNAIKFIDLMISQL
mmetsp:Transcript_4577/g.12560  ORF Transcript_4577/g.12560 Transcript_4577/m.12560 type:complete len:489 (-) Transcript_4577:34-1500(-)|eukprot:CAMPEP_0179103166 /NCGR_PEP_ID=MMETSP0796-20121207/47785_1 /TAXON_ID=73915 /ORGANISM="Pyrodinium bahamense, Strain pbaha01" /LENGTH=488 /DNA_ID=CAMNT_0020801059 /DNA_START=53 /DNA_END=1519 /DNA_ORIENTATION=-